MKYILTLWLAIALFGCTRTETVYETQDHYVTMEDDWLKDCVIVSPPEVAAYQAAPEGVRNAMWSKVYVRQVLENDVCNKGKAKARAYNQTAREKNLLLIQKK
ncbi:hypothetical protein D3C85_239520 [compost metagenome]